jgi:hypothetical protein
VATGSGREPCLAAARAASLSLGEVMSPDVRLTPADLARLQAMPLREMVDGIEAALAEAEAQGRTARLPLALTVDGLGTLRVVGVLLGCARPSQARDSYTGTAEAAQAWLRGALEALGGTLDQSTWPAQRDRLLALVGWLERGQGW